MRNHQKTWLALLLLGGFGSPRGSGCYWLLGLAAGDGVAAAVAAGVFVVKRIFQSSPTRITDQ